MGKTRQTGKLSSDGIFYPDITNSRVGIGTTIPTETLDIRGSLRLTGGLYDTNNVVGAAGSVLISTGVGVSWSVSAGSGGQGVQGTIGDQITAKTYTITVSGGAFYIDGIQQDTIYLLRGTKYKFDQSDSSNSGHPFAISTTSDGTHNSGTKYTSGWTYSGTAGTDGLATFIIPYSALSTLYYYCEVHSGMGGTLIIKDLTANSLQGLQGVQGLSNQGSQGTQGVGSQGIQGLQGLQGLQGIQGPQGASAATAITNNTNNYVVTATGDSNTPFNGESNLTFDGTTLKSPILESTQSSGSEGGEIKLNKPVSSTSIDTGITIDIYENKVRIFETGGTNRGGYWDVTALGVGVTTNLLSGGGGGETGPTGAQGTQGLQGLQGTQGIQGTQGLQGIQGIQGLSNQGIQGLQGLQGTSIQGTQGPAGPPGSGGGVGTGVSIYVSSTPPNISTSVGNYWVDEDDGITYTWFDDGNSQQWVEFGPTPQTISTSSTSSGGGDFNELDAALFS